MFNSCKKALAWVLRGQMAADTAVELSGLDPKLTPSWLVIAADFWKSAVPPLGKRVLLVGLLVVSLISDKHLVEGVRTGGFY